MFADILNDMYERADLERSIRAVLFCVSVMLGTFAATRRVESISEGRHESTDPNAAYPLMVDFIVGGIRAVMEQ